MDSLLSDGNQLCHKNRSVLTFEAGDLVDGESIHINIRCMNYYGLYSYLHSGPVHVVLNPPDTSALHINVITKSLTLYPTRDSHQADTENVIVGWTGIEAYQGLSHLQVCTYNSINSNMSASDIFLYIAYI